MADPVPSAGTDPSGQVRGSWVASIPFRRFDLAKHGGNLLLTDRHLMFKPLRVPLVIGDWVTLTSTTPIWIVPTEEIDGVYAVPGKRSQLCIEKRDGETKNFILVTSRKASIRNSKNAEARDAAIAQISSALS